jgi:excisionase family DNA binding protein
MPEEWLTTQEAAELSGYHPEHIRRLLRSGHLPARKWGQAWMISRDSLLEYLKTIEAKGKKRGPKKAQ